MTASHNLSLAGQYIARGRRFVANQKRQIEQLRQVGADTMDAEHTLRVFQANLRLLENHLQWLKGFG